MKKKRNKEIIWSNYYYWNGRRFRLDLCSCEVENDIITHFYHVWMITVENGEWNIFSSWNEKVFLASVIRRSEWRCLVSESLYFIEPFPTGSGIGDEVTFFQFDCIQILSQPFIAKVTSTFSSWSSCENFVIYCFTFNEQIWKLKLSYNSS